MRPRPLLLSAMLLALVLLIGNCQKADISFEADAVTFSVSGRVLDKDNKPVSQAQVKAGTESAFTDIDGYFRINNIRAPKDAAYVTVDKTGYFPGSRTFIATSRAINFVDIRLIPKEVTGTFAAASGGLVNLTSGGSINFQANSIVDATTNSAYSGTVSVSSFFIDPSDAGFVSIMPGDLRGLNSANDERGLQSFGMMAVELSSGSGQKLQIAGGKNATVSFPIPASLRGRAPATIPLWYFDEVKGLWREEGSATRQGDAYVGTVTHFSFWNCDAPFAVVDFEAVFKDQHGNPHVRAQVTIRRTSNDVLGYGMTDSSGRVKGKIPANEALVLNMMDRCYNLVHTQNIGPFANGVNLGTVTVNSTPSGPVTISGTVVNCSNNPVTNGYVNVYLDGTNRRTNINNGSFSITIPRCNNNPTQAQLLAVDVAASQQGTTVNVPVTTGAVNAGQISACGVNLTEFINYTIDGNSFSFTPPDSLTCFHYSQSFPATTTVMGLDLSGNRDMTFAFADAGNVANVITSLSIRHGNTEYKKSSTSGSMVVTNVQLGNPGDFVSGSFSGSVVNGTTTHTFTCSFRVRRVF